MHINIVLGRILIQDTTNYFQWKVDISVFLEIFSLLDMVYLLKFSFIEKFKIQIISLTNTS